MDAYLEVGGRATQDDEHGCPSVVFAGCKGTTAKADVIGRVEESVETYGNGPDPELFNLFNGKLLLPNSFLLLPKQVMI